MLRGHHNLQTLQLSFYIYLQILNQCTSLKYLHIKINLYQITVYYTFLFIYTNLTFVAWVEFIQIMDLICIKINWLEVLLNRGGYLLAHNLFKWKNNYLICIIWYAYIHAFYKMSIWNYLHFQYISILLLIVNTMTVVVWFGWQPRISIFQHAQLLQTTCNLWISRSIASSNLTNYSPPVTVRFTKFVYCWWPFKQLLVSNWAHLVNTIVALTNDPLHATNTTSTLWLPYIGLHNI